MKTTIKHNDYVRYRKWSETSRGEVFGIGTVISEMPFYKPTEVWLTDITTHKSYYRSMLDLEVMSEEEVALWVLAHLGSSQVK